MHSGAHCPMRRRPRRRTALSRSASPRHYLRERLDDAPSGVQARDPHRVSGLQLRHPALCTRSAARCNTQQHTSGLRVVPRDTREPPKLRQLGHLPGSSRSPVSGDLFITSELLCRLSYPGRGRKSTGICGDLHQSAWDRRARRAHDPPRRGPRLVLASLPGSGVGAFEFGPAVRAGLGRRSGSQSRGAPLRTVRVRVPPRGS